MPWFENADFYVGKESSEYVEYKGSRSSEIDAASKANAKVETSKDGRRDVPKTVVTTSSLANTSSEQLTSTQQGSHAIEPEQVSACRQTLQWLATHGALNIEDVNRLITNRQS